MMEWELQQRQLLWEQNRQYLPVAGLGPVMSPTIISGQSGGDSSSHPSGATLPNMIQLTGRVDAV